MSVVNIDIQKDLYQTNQNDENDFFQLPDGDSFEGRCGEIFISHGKLLIFTCSLCDCKYGAFDDFLNHISIKHYNVDETADIKQEEYERIDDNLSENEFQEETSLIDIYEENTEEEFNVQFISDEIKEEDYAAVSDCKDSTLDIIYEIETHEYDSNTDSEVKWF